MSRRPILVVDDEQSIREMLEVLFVGEGYDVVLASDGREAIDLLEARHFAVVVTDLRMPRATGLDVLEASKRLHPSTQVLVITAFGTHQSALEAMAEGAFDFIEKPFNVDEVRFQVRRAADVHDLAEENRRLKGDDAEPQRLGSMIGRSAAIRVVYDVIQKVARTRTNVLVTGESGTGKEMAARALHQRSDRADGPFVVINCGAIPENLLESELFGYVKGAFSGAQASKPGLISIADSGTLFLDEVGELPLHMQVKLLRVIQERTVMPVGGLHEQRVDIRIIAGTNRNLEAMVAEQTFREDLFYRLMVVHVTMPPLRDRPEDIPLLAGHFLRRYSHELGKDVRAMAPETLDALLAYPFPGNVRELENVLERAVTFATGDTLLSDHLPPNVLRGRVLGKTPAPGDLELPADGMDLEETLASIERDILTQALRRTRGNQTEAARLLGISFRSIRYKVSKYQLDVDGR